MSVIIGIAWYKDESVYRRARAVFADAQNMPATYEDWKTLVERELALIKEGGNIAIRADIDPETLPAWCAARGYKADAQGRTAFVNAVELEYQKTGKGSVIE
jgi:hypothetical protein